jgi:hypothetical protein
VLPTRFSARMKLLRDEVIRSASNQMYEATCCGVLTKMDVSSGFLPKFLGNTDKKSNEIIRAFLLDSEKGITLCFQTTTV